MQTSDLCRCKRRNLRTLNSCSLNAPLEPPRRVGMCKFCSPSGTSLRDLGLWLSIFAFGELLLGATFFSANNFWDFSCGLVSRFQHGVRPSFRPWSVYLSHSPCSS